MGEMNRTLAIANQKGGVGKTTVVLGLASAADAAGDRVLVVDLDPQASSTWVLGIDPDPAAAGAADALAKRPIADAIKRSTWGDRVDVLPASSALQQYEGGKPRRLRRALRALTATSAGNQTHRYDAILLDCPPSNAGLTTSALVAAQYTLVVVEPSSLGLRGIGALADTIDGVWDHLNPDLELSGVILNRVPAVSREAELRIEELALIVGRSTIWEPHIPQRVILNRAVGERRPVHSYGARSAESSAVFDALWQRVLATVGG
ncbi:MAG: ParA family protein [Acidimicrobiia bacterium]|nr:ParA family protein [Acidimicrobiia bacterium]